MKTIHVVAAIICDGDRIFATQRGYGDWKDYWEFPGGKIEPGETPEEALRREIREELDAEISVEKKLTTVEYDYPAFHLSMDCFFARVSNGSLVLKEHEAARWLKRNELDSVGWLPADLTVIELLKGREILDVCNEEGLPTGETVERNTAHRDGILHRTAHVWVVRKTAAGYDILLQKRSMEKDSFPGQYDTSSAGHIPAGEEPAPSAIRELGEELGIFAQPSDLDYAGTFRIRYEKEFHGKMFRDNEVTQVYVYRKPVEIETLSLQESEVDEVRWFDLEEVYKEIQTSRERFCVPSAGLQVLREYLAHTEISTDKGIMKHNL